MKRTKAMYCTLLAACACVTCGFDICTVAPQPGTPAEGDTPHRRRPPASD
jgi:hypothetical protein